MTLRVALTTPDGLVMGADSMTQILGSTSGKYYSNANKVFEVSSFPMVAMTYGLGAVGRRTIGSLIEEWDDERPAFEKGQYTVEEVAGDLCSFVFKKHRAYRASIEADILRSQKEALAGTASEELRFDPLEYTTGLIVGGFQPASRYPWLYSWEEPARAHIPAGLQIVRRHEGADGGDGPEPGINCWGDTASIDRLYYGADGSLIAAIRSLIPAEKQAEAQRLLDDHTWSVLFEGMPLQDAADMVRFMLEVGSGYEQFREGVPSIGGELDIAVVTRSTTHWHLRKKMTQALSMRRSALGLSSVDLKKGMSRATD